MYCVSFLSFSFQRFYDPSFITPNLVTAVGAETKICLAWWQCFCLYSTKTM